MEKGRGQRDEVWERVTLLDGGKRWKCNDCGKEFAAGRACRIKAHLNKVQGKGIRPCTGKANSSNDTEHNLLHSQGPPQSTSLKGQLIHSDRGQIQGDAKYQGRIQVGSSFVSNWNNEDLRMMRYVFEYLSPGELVFQSQRFHLTHEDFITLKPETYLDSWVIDIFVEILTESEKKKATPSNCYLPTLFSKTAVNHDGDSFKEFVERHKIREHYIIHVKTPEKVFIPVHIGEVTSGHFYIYIFHLNKKVVEIWDSYPTFGAKTDRDETTTKLLIAMGELFEKVTFSEFHLKMADNILLQPNGFDCGVFVINYMQQSDNYVKKESSFQFDSQKEREDLAWRLLTNDLNQEKQNLYDKARERLLAQVEKQHGIKRSGVGASETLIDVKYDDRVNRHDGLQKGSSKGYLLPTTDLIGKNFQTYTKQIWEWIMDDKVSAIGVWGIGGSGKTALATLIHNRLILEEASSDIKVIWVTVSQKYSISHLQKVIARSIELDISDEFEVKRIAGKLLQAFKKIKKCVLILDDVWDHFFLKEVGFPMSDNRIKLIMTTRTLEVCQGMDCEKNTVKVESLNEGDSWTLFEKIMGLHEELSLEVKKIAQNISDECEGLPLAIVRIATSLKGKKQVREWSDMLECLKNLGTGQYEIDKWVLPVLRSSYDFLTNKLRRFFLNCVLNAKNGSFSDYDSIRFIRLVYDSIGETKKLRVLYNEGYNMLDKLKNHSMLDECYGKWRINKFLRALAINIVEDTGEIMANADKNLTEIPSDDQWKDDLQKVFLMRNKIQAILDGISPGCSKLSTLLLDGNENLIYISDNFFSNMPALKTLDLSHTRIKRLPESVSSLKSLNALLLSGCEELSYIPPLNNLKLLILLDLSLTAITELPLGLDTLINLRCLNLLHTSKLVIPESLITEFINLEWLALDERALANIKGLGNLEVMFVNFCNVVDFNSHMINHIYYGSTTGSYHFTVGDSSYGSYFTAGDSSYPSYYEGIHIEYSRKRITFEGIEMREIIAAVLPKDMEELFIIKCHQETGATSLCSALSWPNKIDWLTICICKDVKSLCCLSFQCEFCSNSQLVGHLCLWHLKDLKAIVSPEAPLSLNQPSLFSHLTGLDIFNCESMETLMTPELLALLQNLRTIDVADCGKMKEIVGEDDHSKMELGGRGDLSHPTPITLPRLTSLVLEKMPQLNFVYRGVMLCPSLQTFSAVTCAQLVLPRIEISNGCELHMEKTSTGYHWRSD